MLYFLECPYHTQSVKNAFINWTATYRRDSDIVAPYERWQYYDPSVTQIPQTFNYAANKTKKVIRLKWKTRTSKKLKIKLLKKKNNKN